MAIFTGSWTFFFDHPLCLIYHIVTYLHNLYNIISCNLSSYKSKTYANSSSVSSDFVSKNDVYIFYEMWENEFSLFRVFFIVKLQSLKSFEVNGHPPCMTFFWYIIKWNTNLSLFWPTALATFEWLVFVEFYLSWR